MIVFDLQCAEHGHVFEAWFSTSSSYDEQKAKSLLMCPTCGTKEIGKAVMAPNLPAKSNQRNERTKTGMSDAEGSEQQSVKEMIGKIAEIQAKALKESQWVGHDFEKSARAMEAGEVDRVAIHGQATPEQARSMVEDGIPILPLLVPVTPPEQLN